MDIPGVLKELEDLIDPNQGANTSLADVFTEKYLKFREKSVHKLTKFEDTIDLIAPFAGEPWWSFHTLVLNKLFELKYFLSIADEQERLISINEQKTLKATVEMVIVLGIVNHLPLGIGIKLKHRSVKGSEILTKSTDDQSRYSLCLTVECLMNLRDDETIGKVVSKHHLGDLMAALFALLFPVTWTVPIDFRHKAKMYLETLIEKEFQPNVIKELMLLHGNVDRPVPVSRAFRGFLTDRLMQRVGVVATIKAILDLTQGLSSPQHWRTVNTLSKLITTPHIRDIDAYKTKVYPQILQLVYANEVEYMQVAVSCVRELHDSDPSSCKKWFVDKLIGPLLSSSSEEEIALSIEGLHNCCGVPCSENWALPLKAVEKAHVNIFRLHCRTHSSIYHLKMKVGDLVSAIVDQSDPKDTYSKLLFENGTVNFAFGEHGGINAETGDEGPDWDTAPDLLLETISSKSSQLKYDYFKAALEAVTDGEFEKKLVGSKFLSELANDDSVQENINKNPTAIIEFIGKLLKTKSKEQDQEVACLGLMAISVILDDQRYKNTRDWEAFLTLVDPLKEFQRKTSNLEVKVLAEQLRCTILSHGGVTAIRKTEFKSSSNYDEAMKEAVDKLLPIRAHGLMSLAKLIAGKDKDTYIKRDVLLCLFKENLKEEDPFVYLAAIEGLAVLAATYPDEVLTALTEQYRQVKDSEVRMKVGETLTKVARHLNEMAVVYKGELIGAYVQGALDDDHLVRASSLSNLGEVFKILGLRVHAYLVDVLQLISSILQTEKHPEPRRAAVMVITLLLQGLGGATFSTLQELVLDIIRSLKRILRTENDDITRLHAELALQELNTCTINFLTPPQKMEKRIFVLDPLP